MNIVETEVLLETAISAAKFAGNFAKENKFRRQEVAQMLDHDVKLRMDIETQKMAESFILERFPDHTILGEEGQGESKADVYEWIIDPIDGTVNYTNDMLIWCTSIAVRLNGKILAGCVYAPELNECYYASVETPAFCNDVEIHPSSKSPLSAAYIHSGLERSSDPAVNRKAVEYLFALTTQTHKVRVCGAAALDICNVARGRGDGFIERGLYLWDVAAAGLIAERAGAIAETLENKPNYGVSFICTNGKIHADLKDLFLNYFPIGN